MGFENDVDVLAAVEIPETEEGNELKIKVWKIVIWAFSIVLVGSFLTLAISVFVPPATGGTSGQMILTVFTTVVGFLAGLFSPSPVEG